MNHRKQTSKQAIVCWILSGALALSMAGCAPKNEGVAISGESVDVGNVALRPEGQAFTTYENGGVKLLVPMEYNELVTVETPQDGSRLFYVCEKASVEAAKAQGENSEGAGELFGIQLVDEAALHEMLCGDMSGAEAIAKASDGSYYLLTHPTDVRYVRENYEGMGDEANEDWKQWTSLVEWANSVPDTFVSENGLTAVRYGNTEPQIFLFRAAYQPNVNYTVSTTEYGPMAPNGVDPTPYAERLAAGVFEYADGVEAPDGEYAVLAFPDEDYRFDFFFQEGKENFVRQVWLNGENETLYKVTFDDDTKASAVMKEWYDALVAANDMSKLGYTADDYVGTWAEKVAGRGVITIEKAAADSYTVHIEWANGAAEQYVWDMTATPTAANTLRYENGTHEIRTYSSDGSFTMEPQYSNGTGEFALNSANEIMWTDEINNAGENCVFISAG